MLILSIWLVRGEILDNSAPYLRCILVYIPKYAYELPWLAENHENQVTLYIWLSFSLICLAAGKTLLFSLYIVLTPLGRNISVNDKSASVSLAGSLLLFFAFIVIPLPIYGEGSSTTVLGNAYFLTFLNIVMLKMLSGGISATVLLAKRIKKRA
ncbi:hypothetical protein HFN83_03815 [Rhizobium laguerreae]|nr:hypothetical protein [Rhizobium laguerreae]